VNKLFTDLQNELDRQRKLKAAGKFEYTAEDFMQVGHSTDMLAVLTEEVGEVARAINDNAPCVELREELLQVAAVAISAIIGLDYAMVGKASAI
jgi:hypothetical protein